MTAGLSIIRRLAVGGTAEIVLARQSSGRSVVIKRLLPEATELMVTRLGREADILARIQSPHLVGLLGRADRELLLEYVEGVDAGALSVRLAKRGEALPPEAVVAVGLGVAQALTAIHGSGFVHADISPGNVLVGRDGQVKVCDLGIARQKGDPAPREPEGTLAYQPPEQLTLQPIDESADVFAAGLIFYELCTGVPGRPSGQLGLAELVAARRQRLAPPSVVRPGLPASFDQLLEDVLDPDPSRRPSAAGWSERLQRMPSDASDLKSLVASVVGVPIPSARTTAAPSARTSPVPVLNDAALRATIPTPAVDRRAAIPVKSTDGPKHGWLATQVDGERPAKTQPTPMPDADTTSRGRSHDVTVANVSPSAEPLDGPKTQLDPAPPTWSSTGEWTRAAPDPLDRTTLLASSDPARSVADDDPLELPPTAPGVARTDLTPLIRFAPRPRSSVNWAMVVACVAAASAVTAYVQTRSFDSPTEDPAVVQARLVEGRDVADPVAVRPVPIERPPVATSPTPTMEEVSTEGPEPSNRPSDRVASPPPSTAKARPAPKRKPRESKRPTVGRRRKKTPAARSPKLRLIADASVRVSGAGITDGPAPKTIRALADGPTMLTLTSRGLSVRLRVFRSPSAVTLTVAAPPGTFYRVQCGDRPRRWTPLVDVPIRRTLACTVEEDETEVRFEVQVGRS